MALKEVYTQTQFSPAEYVVVCDCCGNEIDDQDACIENNNHHYHGDCAVSLGITTACTVCGTVKENPFENCDNGCQEAE